MSRSFRSEAVAALVMIAGGVAARLYFHEIPNFAPVAGIALFAGFVFSHMGLAAAVPLGVMAISDQLLGGYEPVVQLTVYACLALPVLLRGPLRSAIDGPPETLTSLLGRATLLTTMTLGCSLIFFLLTNTAVWAVGKWYPRDLGGLLACFTNALPFFRYTAAGDMVFSFLLFGGWTLWALVRSSWATSASPALDAPRIQGRSRNN